MQKWTVFKIFLMGAICFLSCESEPAAPKFSTKEQAAYQQIKEDFSPPQFKWGYLNKRGELEIGDVYDDLREFSDGKAAYNKDGLWGYINKDGSVFLEARYRLVETFSEGYAVAQDLNDKYHIIRGDGTPTADSLSYQRINKFSSGRALVSDGQRYGYIDPTGHLILPMIYDMAEDFKDGHAIVSTSGKVGMIDSTGQTVIGFTYDKLWHASADRIRYQVGKKYGFLNSKYDVDVMPIYMTATDYQDDHAVVTDGDRYLLLDKAGKTQTLPYSFVDFGGEGKWIYGADARWGVLANDGSVLSLPMYDLILRYKEDRAGFAIGESWGYLDEQGQIVIQAIYPLVWDFVGGYARMISSNGYGFIDKRGHPLLESAYMEVRDFSEGLARIQVYR